MSASRHPPRAAAAGRSAFGRSLLVFLGLSAGAVLTSALLLNIQEWMLAVFTAVAWGLAGLGLGGGGGLDPEQRVWLNLTGFFLIAAAGILAVVMVEYPLLGTAARDIAVEDAPAQTFANTYTFRDGRVLTDAQGSAIYTTRRGAFLGTVSVAPVVSKHWQAGQPVAVWAVTRASNNNADSYASDLALWQQPAQAGVRVVSFQENDYRQAVKDAEQNAGLQAADNLIFIRWTPDPGAEVGQAWLKLLAIVAGAAGLWGVVLLGARLAALFKR